MILVAQVLLAWLLADFLSGAFHFFEDRILSDKSRFEFLQGVINDNILHHEKPAALLKETWIGNMSTTAVITIPWSLFLYVQTGLSVWFMTVFFLTFGNLVHRFAHDRNHRKNKFIVFMQELYLFCPVMQHDEHHYKRFKLVARPDSSIRYCVMSGLLNPVLDRIKFWDGCYWIYRRFV